MAAMCCPWLEWLTWSYLGWFVGIEVLSLISDQFQALSQVSWTETNEFNQFLMTHEIAIFSYSASGHCVCRHEGTVIMIQLFLNFACSFPRPFLFCFDMFQGLCRQILAWPDNWTRWHRSDCSGRTSSIFFVLSHLNANFARLEFRRCCQVTLWQTC